MSVQQPEASDSSLAPVLKTLSQVESPPIEAPVEAMTIHVTLPPGSPGAPPHRHPGPGFGYVIQGELRLEVEGQPERVVKAGEAFWEPGGRCHPLPRRQQPERRRDDVRRRAARGPRATDPHSGSAGRP